MPIRGVRGATVAEADQPQAIYQATQELLKAIMDANPTLRLTDLASAIFTVTQDLRSAFPASVARSLDGWRYVPLLCAQEIPVPNSLSRVVRVLLHWNTDLPQNAIRHVYLREASCLRPDMENIRPGGNHPG
jgi:chorismate mutase